MKNLLNLLKDNAKLNVVGGITLSLLGILCVYLPFISGLTVAGVVSLAMIGYGMSISIFAFTKEKTWHKILSFIAGILVALFGGLMFINPMTNLYALAIIAVSFFVIDGITSLFTAYEIRKSKVWGWSLFNGIISLILAGLLISQWPLASFFIVGTIIGVRLIFSGFKLVLLATTGYGLLNSVEEVKQENDNEQSSDLKDAHAV